MEQMTRYADAIRSSSLSELRTDTDLGGKLQMIKNDTLTISYAPFDYVNLHARVVLVGITPGRQQARNALLAAWPHLVAGADLRTASKAAK